MRRFIQKVGQVLFMPKPVSLKIQEDDAELLLTVINQVSATGKESIIQVLRIITALEQALPIIEKE